MRKFCEVHEVEGQKRAYRAWLDFENGAKFGFTLRGGPRFNAKKKAGVAAMEISEIMMAALILIKRGELSLPESFNKSSFHLVDENFFNHYNSYDVKCLKKVNEDLEIVVAAGPKEWNGFEVDQGNISEDDFFLLWKRLKKHVDAIKDANPEKVIPHLRRYMLSNRYLYEINENKKIKTAQGIAVSKGLSEILTIDVYDRGGDFMISPPNDAALHDLALGYAEGTKNPKKAEHIMLAKRDLRSRQITIQENEIERLRKEVLPLMSEEARVEVEGKIKMTEEKVMKARKEEQELQLRHDVEMTLYAIESQLSNKTDVSDEPTILDDEKDKGKDVLSLNFS